MEFLNTPAGIEAQYTVLVDPTTGLPYAAGGGGGGGGGASAAEIEAALTATNANMEGNLQNIAADMAKVGATVVGGKQLIGGASDKWRDSFESLDPANWDFDTARAPNDTVTLSGDTQGASFMEICMDAFSKATSTEIKGYKTFRPPYRLGYGGSVSQRGYGEMTIVSVAAVDESGNRIIASGETESFFGPSLTVKKIIVTSNVATVIFDQPHNLKFDDIVVISEASDNRMNVQGRVTTVRSRYAVTMPLTATNGNYLPGATCVLNRIDPSKGSSDCAGVVMMDALDANGIYFSRGQGSSNFLSANTSFGTSYSAGLLPSPQPFSVNIQPRFLTEFIGAMDVQRWISSAIDSNTPGVTLKRSQNVPDPAKNYAMFFDVVALPNRAVPIEVLTVVKTGTTTATVTTVNPHNLVTGRYVYGYGSRNQSTLANLTAPTAITVTGPSTLTLVWGTAVTETTYGGMLIPQNGGAAVPGALNTSIMGSAWYNGRLYLGTYISTVFTTGDVVRLIGVRDAGGAARANMGGRMRVVAINPNVQEAGILTGAATTTGSPTLTMPETGAVPYGGYLTGTGIAANSFVSAITANTSVTLAVNASATNTQLQDITLTGVVLEPIDFVAPANAQPMVMVSAGAIFRETTLRMNFARCLDYTRTPVELTGGHYTGDTQQALAIHAPSTLTVSAAQSSAAALGTTGTGAWPVRGGAVRIADIASAAITSTSVGTAIGAAEVIGGVQYTVDVSAASGTNPRMYPRVQESIDGGANFVTTFDFTPVVAATDKTNVSPVLPLVGTSMRWVRKLTGTSPSFTNSCTRTVRALENPPVFRQLVDSVVSLTAVANSTDYLYVANCVRAQIALTLAAATTVPSAKMQICDGDPTVAANWYDVPGASITGAASSTVASVVVELPPAKFARFAITGAGSGITADTYTLLMKAWG